MSGAVATPGEAAKAGAPALLRPLLMLGGIAVILAGAARLWLGAGSTFSTDDAYIRAAKLAVSTDVAGIVTRIAVREGQSVKRGQLLYQLDPAPFQHAVDAARARLAAARDHVQAAKRDYRRALQEHAAKQAQLAADQADLARYASLVGRGGVTRAEYDHAHFQVAADQASLNALAEQGEMQLAELSGNASIDPAQTPQVMAAAAELAEAQRQLAHTAVTAPFDGVAVNVDAITPGQYLTASAAAFGLVSAERVWVEAYPKETQLTWAQPGDAASVSVDTYPGQGFAGTLASISQASGASFAVLPAQNASGNWVKVVQRIPIRIELANPPPNLALRDGMSVTITVTTSHKRSWQDLF